MVQERRLSIKKHAEKHADSFSAPPYKSAEKLSQTYFFYMREVFFSRQSVSYANLISGFLFHNNQQQSIYNISLSLHPNFNERTFFNSATILIGIRIQNFVFLQQFSAICP